MDLEYYQDLCRARFYQGFTFAQGATEGEASAEFMHKAFEHQWKIHESVFKLRDSVNKSSKLSLVKDKDDPGPDNNLTT